MSVASSSIAAPGRFPTSTTRRGYQSKSHHHRKPDHHQTSRLPNNDNKINFSHSVPQSPMREIPLLPPQRDTGKLTVVLDLDETLVHSYIVERASEAARHAIYVKNEENGGHYVNVRPGVAELLRIVGSLCEGVLWTAGTKEYAARVIEIVDYAGVLEHKIFRSDEWYKEDGAKRLTKIGRDMKSTIIIDNSMSAIANNAENAILVDDYIDDEDDDTLYTLAHLVQEMVISGFSVPDFLAACPLLHKRPIPGTYRKPGGPHYFYHLRPRF